MNKKRKSLIVVTTCVAAAAVGILVGGTKGAFNKRFAKAESGDAHTVSLTADNGLTSEEVSAKTFTRTTNSGNPIVFKTYGGASFKNADGNFAMATDTNAWVYNETAINGLESLAFRCSNTGAKVKVFFFNEAVNASRNNWVSNSGELTGFNEYVVDIPRYENPIKYVVWQQLNVCNDWLRYFTFNFSCSSSLAARGHAFSSAGSDAFDIEETPASTASITVDVKWTDFGANNGKAAIGILSPGWSDSFGYKSVYKDTATGDIPGLYVSHLSDGYTRFTWKCSEMQNTSTGDAPTTISVVHVRAEWTESEGYFDVNPSVNVVEYQGKKFVAGTNCDLRYSSVTLADYIMQVDVKFNEGTTTDQKANFYVADSSACATYYGNYGLRLNQITDNPVGTTFEILDSGVRRYTFDFSLCAKGTGTKPTTSIYSYLRGGWTDASGIIAFSFIAK